MSRTTRPEPGGLSQRRAWRLPLPALLALRYLRSTRRDAFTTFLSAVALGAIALGVAALILFLAALAGFQHVLRTEILARTAPLEVTLAAGADPDAALTAARGVPGVVRVTPVTRGRGWLVSAGRVAPVQLVGFDGPVPPAFPGFEGGTGGLVLSRRQATVWGLRPGDRVDLVSPRPTLTPLGPQPRLRTLSLTGLYEGTRPDEGEHAALPLGVARSLFPGERPRMVVEGADFEAALALVPALTAALPAASRIETWQDLNRPLFFALALERVFLFVGVGLIVLVAALALLADLALVMANKRRDLGVLLALGATPKTLERAFQGLGALLAGIGTLLGTGLGVGLSLLCDRFGLIRLPGHVFFVDHVPFRLRALDLVEILAVTVLFAALATLFAARRVSSLEPLEALAG